MTTAQAILIFGLLSLATTMTVIPLVVKHGWLFFVTAVIWLFFSLTARASSTEPVTGVWDIFYGMFLFGAIATVACALLAATIRTTKSDDKGDVVLSDVEQQEKYNDDLWRAAEIPRFGRRGYTSRRKRQ